MIQVCDGTISNELSIPRRGGRTSGARLLSLLLSLRPVFCGDSYLAVMILTIRLSPSGWSSRATQVAVESAGNTDPMSTPTAAGALYASPGESLTNFHFRMYVTAEGLLVPPDFPPVP